MLMGWTRRETGAITALNAVDMEPWAQELSQSPEVTYSEGIAAGTLIATPTGWRSIESLSAGEMVLTFDNGPERVREVARKVLWSGQGTCPRAMWPLAVPAGVLGNARPMLLLPDQNVMLESDLAEELLGDPFALVPAAALEGYCGIVKVYPHRRIEVISLRFDEDQVVYANGSGMLHCGSVRGLALTIDVVVHNGPYMPLSLERGRQLVALMAAQGEGAQAAERA